MDKGEIGVFAALALLMSTSMALAQPAPDLSPGTRVRVIAPGAARQQMTGTLLTVDEKTVTIINDGKQPVKVPRELVTRLDVSWGRKRHVLPGLLIGAAGAGLLGAVMPLCSPDIYGHTSCSTRAELIGGGLAGGAGIGAIVGALVKSEQWVELPLDRVRVSLNPRLRAQGVGLSLSVAF